MRVVLFGDMEGVCGIQSWEHTGGASPLYEEGRRLYTDEVNAAVRGCLSGGAESVVVQDGHGGAYPGGKPFMNWIPDRLTVGAEYVRGFRWARYVEPLERGECDAIGFIGAHARAGIDDGVLCHTVNADGWYSVLINGEPIGESGILAAIAGTFGVPAVCIAGDEAACAELTELIGPQLVTAAVKRGLGRYAVRMPAPADAHRLIEDRFRAAMQDRLSWPEPFRPSTPVEITVALASPDRAVGYLAQPGVARVDDRTVRSQGTTFWEAWSRLWLPG